MQYIYLNNVRGFSRTLIPIRACNFLVGENSTGKSSFLSLLRLLSRPDFLFQSQISLDADSPSAFSDLVSAWASDKSHFDIGMLDVDMRGGSRPRLIYRVHRFSESSGVPVTTQYIQRRASNAVHLRFSRTSTEYFRTGDLNEPADESSCVAEFWAAAATLDSPSVSASVESLIADRAELKVRLEGMDSLAAQFRTSEAAERAMRDARDQARDEVNLLRGQVQAMERQVTYLMSTHVPHTKGRRTRNGQRPKAETTN